MHSSGGIVHSSPQPSGGSWPWHGWSQPSGGGWCEHSGGQLFLGSYRPVQGLQPGLPGLGVQLLHSGAGGVAWHWAQEDGGCWPLQGSHLGSALAG